MTWRTGGYEAGTTPASDLCTPPPSASRGHVVSENSTPPGTSPAPPPSPPSAIRAATGLMTADEEAVEVGRRLAEWMRTSGPVHPRLGEAVLTIVAEVGQLAGIYDIPTAPEAD